MVCQGAAGALLLGFPFIDLCLINTSVRVGPDTMHYFLPRCLLRTKRVRESSYPTLAHEPPEMSDATPPSSPNVGTIGHQPSPGKLRPLTYI